MSACTHPLVSVIVPCYNHAKYVEEALYSVYRQDYRPLELIVIDDGSTDRTAFVAEQFVRRYMPGSVFISRPNIGAARTLNQGISLASGDFVSFLNSDDSYCPTRISSCVGLATQEGAEFIYTDVRFVDNSGNIAEDDDYILGLREAQRRSLTEISLGFAFLRDQLAISTGNFFVSRRLAQCVGPFFDYKYVHDWDFLLRSLFYVEPRKISRPLYNYRFHSSNSFKTLGQIAEYETTEIVRNFFCSVMSRYPVNALAPCPYYWPGVFEHFVRSKRYEHYMPPRFRFAFNGTEWLS